MEEIVYLNGLLKRGEARISPMDYGFLYGYGVFETMRAYNGAVFRLDRHLKRLEESAGRLEIPVDISVLRSAVTGVLSANKLTEARVRLTVSPGEGSLSPEPHTCRTPVIFAAAAPYSGYHPDVYEKGFSLMVPYMRRNSRSPIVGIKSANYLECLLARQEARLKGFDDALLLNENRRVTETSSANVFFVFNNILKTPRIENGILPGITREAVLELAEKHGIQVFKTDITFNDLSEPDEAFLTNSIIEIMPVTAINWKKVGSGKPGPLTLRLKEAYKALVKEEACS